MGILIQKAVMDAIREAQSEGIDKLGKEVTPWVLKRVAELSDGKSLLSSK